MNQKCLLNNGSMLSLGRADFKLISSWAHSRDLQRTTSCSLPLPPHPPPHHHPDTSDWHSFDVGNDPPDHFQFLPLLASSRFPSSSHAALRGQDPFKNKPRLTFLLSGLHAGSHVPLEGMQLLLCRAGLPCPGVSLGPLQAVGVL